LFENSRSSTRRNEEVKMSHEATPQIKNDWLRVSDLPQLIDDVQKLNLGFVVKSGGERILFRFGEMTPALRLELESLADEYKPTKRAA
jgi:hypothetical protein